ILPLMLPLMLPLFPLQIPFVPLKILFSIITHNYNTQQEIQATHILFIKDCSLWVESKLINARC
ncbi:MAG: hypothetical protein V3S69_01225, partial [Dehalococcoidales bacterium]